MPRLWAAVIVAAGAALVWAARSPAFNADLSSPDLVRSLTADYLAVDAVYGGVTNPYLIDGALHQSNGSQPSVAGFGSRPPLLTIANGAEGVHDAQQAEEAVAALGATAELAPIRRELLQCYRDVEQAWRLEQQAEEAQTIGGTAALAGRGAAFAPEAAANTSADTIRQARSLHDQAMAAVRVLSGATPAANAGRPGGQGVYSGVIGPYRP
jgi:hypothetical protein